MLSLAKQAFKHASLTAVTKQETLPPRNGTPAFSVAFTYDDSHDGLRAVLAFVHEHAGPSAPGELQILTISSRASNRWLIPLIGLGVSVALALALALALHAASFSKNRLINIFAVASINRCPTAAIVPPMRVAFVGGIRSRQLDPTLRMRSYFRFGLPL